MIGFVIQAVEVKLKEVFNFTECIKAKVLQSPPQPHSIDYLSGSVSA